MPKPANKTAGHSAQTQGEKLKNISLPGKTLEPVQFPKRYACRGRDRASKGVPPPPSLPKAGVFRGIRVMPASAGSSPTRTLGTFGACFCRVAIAAQGAEVVRGISSAEGDRNNVVDLQVVGAVAQHAPVAVASLDRGTLAGREVAAVGIPLRRSAWTIHVRVILVCSTTRRTSLPYDKASGFTG